MRKTFADDNKTVTKIEFEGKMMPAHETYGLYVQEKPIPTINDRGIRNCAEMLQWAIGKDVVITVELKEP